MNRTRRQLQIDRALLGVLANVPDGYLLQEEVLRADTARVVVPRPSTAELDEAIQHADRERRLVGVPTEDGMKWRLSDVGRAWRAEHA